MPITNAGPGPSLIGDLACLPDRSEGSTVMGIAGLGSPNENFLAAVTNDQEGMTARKVLD